MTEHYLYRGKRIKEYCLLLIYLPKKFLYKVSLKRIKEQVGKKRNTVGSHWKADSLLKYTYSKRNKYVVNQEIKHLDNVSFRECFVGIIGIFFTKYAIKAGGLACHKTRFNPQLFSLKKMSCTKSRIWPLLYNSLFLCVLHFNVVFLLCRLFPLIFECEFTLL